MHAADIWNRVHFYRKEVATNECKATNEIHRVFVALHSFVANKAI